MRLTNIHLTAAIMILSGAVASADTITLRSGEVVQGTFIGGTARQIRFRRQRRHPELRRGARAIGDVRRSELPATAA